MNSSNPSERDAAYIARVNDLASLMVQSSSFHPDGPKNAAVDDEIVIYSRGALRRGRVVKATAKGVTVDYVTPGGIEVAKKLCALALSPAYSGGFSEKEREDGRAGRWQLWTRITTKRVGRDHNGTPKKHVGFNCIA